MKTILYLLVGLLFVFFVGCSSSSSEQDAGSDSGVDAQDAGGDEEPIGADDAGAEDGDGGGDDGADEGGDPSDAGAEDGDAGDDAGGDDEGEPDAGADADAGGDEVVDGGDGDAGDRLTASACWAHKADPNNPGPEYDQFNPIIGSHCLGTNHQDITGIEKLVFLGDSVTTGTTSLPYYRTVLRGMLEDRFGSLEVVNKSAFGARTDDLLLPSNQQILEAFPNLPEPKRTLVVMTVGGNDFFKMAEAFNEGASPQEIMDMAAQMIQLFEDAIHWFRDDPTRFPNGVSVIFSNVFEYTDGTGNMSACPTCLIVGLCGNWPEGRAPAIYMNDNYMRIAVETQTDMVFMLEHFCGHGWEYDNPAGQCYLGPDTPQWIDFTCIHPTTEGHQAIADMFWAVVNE